MGDPVAVLVVPAEGDPGGLLAPGRCGAYAPSVFRCSCGRWDHAGCASFATGTPTRALPLWWDDALVPEGWDRARRVIEAQGWSARSTMPQWTWQMTPGLAGVLVLAEDMVARGLASRAVLLGRVDGRLVERAP